MLTNASPRPHSWSRFCLLLLLALLAAPLVLAQAIPAQRLTAYVDRTDITLNDVITLTIRVDASMGNNRPSLAGLNQDFDQVGGISTRSTYTNNGGTIQSWTEYSIMLRPKATGSFSIPGFRVGTETTSPILVTVSEAGQGTTGGNDEIFLRSSVSKEDIYVQEQLLYTIRIYYSIGFDQGAQLSSPQVQNAVVQQLGSDENFQEVVDGIGYSVTERRFVIYPQASGELQIPPVYFSASVGRRGGINRFFSNRNTVREINLNSDAHTINVKARPASFPGQTWLPAAELTLTESWSGELDNVEVGDAITRNVVLTTKGLSSSLLPGIEYADQVGLRFYPDQPVREDSANRDGVIGTRSEGTAMVASRPGEYLLPEVQLPWWNTETDQMQMAVLPARTITVVAPAAGEGVTAGDEPLPGLLPPREAGFQEGSGGASSLWIASTAVFGVAWLLTLFLWLHSKRQLAYVETVGVSTATASLPESRLTGARKPASAVRSELPEAASALRVLKTACDSGKLPDVRKALLKWGQASLQDAGLQTLAQVAHKCHSAALTQHLKQLDAAVYGASSDTPDLQSLYDTVARLHKTGITAPPAAAKYALPPLYKH
jgi:hypothetical protein